MDDLGAGGPGRRRDDDRLDEGIDDDVRDGIDAARARDPAPEYDWGGKPGEDFGPIPPPGPLTGSRRRPADDPFAPRPADTTARRRPADPFADETPSPGETGPNEPTRRQQTVRPSTVRSAPLRPDGVFSDPVRRPRRWRPILALLGLLVVLGGLTAGVLLVISQPGILGLLTGTPADRPTATASPPAVAQASPAAVASPAGASSPVAAAASPPAPAAPAASPTPRSFIGPSPTLPPRSPVVAAPTARTVPAILPTPPSLIAPAPFVTPPGLRFATSTPARVTTPSLARTPPPIGSPRLPSFSARIWSEQTMHRAGDTASICGQASTGGTAELTVIEPDRASLKVGEFTPPAERVCYARKVEKPGLYVLSIIIKDAGGNEIDRQSATFWVSR